MRGLTGAWGGAEPGGGAAAEYARRPTPSLGCLSRGPYGSRAWPGVSGASPRRATQVRAAAEQGKRDGARMVVCPELQLTGAGAR
jgi:hypothetical protein